MRRRVSVPAVALLAAAGLTGCATGSAVDTCATSLAPGALSSSVELRSADGAATEISVDGDAQARTVQRSVIVEADTRESVAEPGTIVGANLAYFDSVTGELLEASPAFGSGTAGELFLATEDGGPVVQGILCAAPGETLAIALSTEESAGAVTTPGASLVVVAEVLSVAPPHAEGALRPLPGGFPAVVIDESGRVGMVLPPQAPPSETTSAVRIAGDGAEVEADQMIIGNVLTVGWDGTELKNSFATGPENLGSESQVEQSGATFRAELTGVPVGSQVVVIEPGDGSPRVSVIDILAVA